MKSEQLRAFVSVVEQGSFRAAASHLYKTQPTISASVQALEQQFGFTLFNRDSYRPVLTAEGKTFYKEAKRLLGQVSELESLGHRLARGAAPTLSISLSAMCAMPPRLSRIKLFCSQHPDLQLTLSTEHLSGILEQLLLEKADVAIGPHTGLDERYDFVAIDKICMITVAAPEFVHSLWPDSAQEPQPAPNPLALTQSQLRHRAHILVADTGSRRPFDHVNVLSGGQRWYVKDYQVKKALLLAGMGWARIPLHMVQAELDSGALIPLEVEQFASRSEVPIYLIRLRHTPLSELASQFWQAMLNSSDGGEMGV